MGLNFILFHFKTKAFLNEFIEEKVERVKYLADLFRKVIRFDAVITSSRGAKSLQTNPLGIFKLDKELASSY